MVGGGYIRVRGCVGEWREWWIGVEEDTSGDRRKSGENGGKIGLVNAHTRTHTQKYIHTHKQ